jgi:hypothetical protein
MKNIFLLPTEESSRIGRFVDTQKLILRSKKDIPRGENVNIYITSDEELPYDNSIFATGAFYHRDAAKDIHIITKDTFHPNPNFCSRIILTTDDSLFKYGVQAIDDEFLERFVKNPTCEFVEVNKKLVEFPLTFKMMYKIIIPQKESKQETLEEAAENYSVTFIEDDGTAEVDFIAGAKWQAERMYSEEEVIELLTARCKHFGTTMTPFRELLLKQDLEWFEQFKKK